MRAKSWEKHKAECEAITKDGITILGFVGPWEGNQTKLHCHCTQHGDWKTTSIDNFKRGCSCPKCRDEKRGVRAKTLLTNKKYRLKEHPFHVEGFMKTGKFHPETKFFRSERLDHKGVKSYWNYTCPVCSNDEYVKAGVCSGVFEAPSHRLKKGSLPCRCSKVYICTKEQWEYRLDKLCKERGYQFMGWKTEKFSGCSKFIYLCPSHGEHSARSKDFLKGTGCPQCAGKNQKECYINTVWDQDVCVGLKFGISVDSESRVKHQNSRNLFQMQQLLVYTFSDVNSCKVAEKACLSELKCSILNERELKDGWTETTSIQNLDKIIEIYERFGGVRIK